MLTFQENIIQKMHLLGKIHTEKVDTGKKYIQNYILI